MWMVMVIGGLVGLVALSLLLGGWAAPFAIAGLLAVGVVVLVLGFRRGANEERRQPASQASGERERSGSPDAEHETWVDPA